jgi:DNA-binding LacI/PurR family transcriptional regulator
MGSKVLQKSNLLYQQVKAKIEEGIASGAYKEGDCLPSERTLSKHLGISMITTRRALNEMATDGILEKKWGKGVFVKKSLPPIVVPKKIALTVIHSKEYLSHPAVSGVISGLASVIGDSKEIHLEVVFISPSMIENSDYSLLLERDFDGLITTIQEIPVKSMKLIKKHIPHMIAINQSKMTPSVSFDFEDATRVIMRHLYDHGHRRIALLNGIKDSFISNAVLKGYTDFILNEGGVVDKDIIRFGFYDRNHGRELTEDILRSKKVSAIITGDDNMALGALDAILKAGLKCPDDISICSFNDFPFASMIKPALTTVRVPFYEIGKLAAEVLMHSMNFFTTTEEMFKLKGELIVRESVCHCAKKRNPIK